MPKKPEVVILTGNRMGLTIHSGQRRNVENVVKTFDLKTWHFGRRAGAIHSGFLRNGQNVELCKLNCETKKKFFFETKCNYISEPF